MIQTYKYLQGIYDSNADKIFTRTHETRTRGHDLKLFKERALTSTRANFFTSRVIDTWNSLPQEVVSAPSTDAFKARLDKYWHNVVWLYDYKADTK